MTPDVTIADRAIDQAAGKPRVWLLTNAPSPYQMELLGAVAQSEGIDLETRLMRASSNAGAVAGIRLSALVMTGLAPRSWRDELRLHPRALWEAAFGRFDCYILSGLYTSITFLLCALLLALRGKPWAVWLERPRAHKYRLGKRWPGARFIQWIRGAVLRWILRRATRIIGIGTAAVEAYRELGAADDRLLMLPYCTNTHRYAAVNQDDVAAIRRRLTLDGCTTFLFSGQMIHRKGVDQLLTAFAQLAAQRPAVKLILLGAGPMLEEYMAATPEDLRDRVHFAGHVSQSELPAWFNAADVFVFPTRHDGWGVVINEACAAGLPIIASIQTGAAFDLVEEEINGFRIDCADVSGFVEKMRYFVDDDKAIKQFGRASRSMAERCSIETGADRFLHHIRATLSAPVI